MLPRMADQPRLQPASQIRCTQCRQWHHVIAVHTTGTAYTLNMRYFECRGLYFYAGQDGGVSRHRTRQRPNAYVDVVPR